MIVKNIYQSQFIDEFRAYGREDNFSILALETLYEYIDNYSDEIGEPVELDVIAICSEYSEYSTLEEFQEDYGTDYEDIEDIRQETTVIELPYEYGFIIQDF